MGNKIIVTGANGFIGANLSNHLLSKGYDITCLVRQNADTSLINSNQNIISIDYNDTDTMNSTISQYDIIIHLAAMTKARTFDQIYQANVKLTENIVNIANSSQNCKQIIFISSQAATGPSAPQTPKTEDELEYPVSWYGNSKLLAEIKVKLSQKNWTILRPCSVYGEGDKDFLTYFKMVKRHLTLIPGLYTKYISLIYVQDLVQTIEKCIDNPKVFNQLLHISDNVSYTMKDFTNSIKETIGKHSLSIQVPDKIILLTATICEMFYFGDKAITLNKQKAIELIQENWLIDCSKVYKLLNLSPTAPLLENLKKTYLWYLEKHYL